MCVVGEDPVVGINARPFHCHPVSVPLGARVRAWTELGVAYGNGDAVSNAMAAFEEAIVLSTRSLEEGESGEQKAVRREGCYALSNAAWMCLHMSRVGAEWKERKDGLTVGGLFQKAMQTLFLAAVQGHSSVTYGAGRLPGNEEEGKGGAVLLAKVSSEEGKGERFFFFDEDLCVVREWSDQATDDAPSRDGEAERTEDTDP